MKLITLTLAALVLTLGLSAAENDNGPSTGSASSTSSPQAELTTGVHLFILSGQSNMAGLKSDVVFTPIVKKAFGEDNVIVVRKAWSGRPIRVWYDVRKNPKTNESNGPMGLYKQMMTAVKEEVKDRKLASVTFVWMQGETDAGEKKGDDYEACLNGLLAEVKKDLGIETLNVVIGRICDYDREYGINPHWKMVRDVQVKIAESDPNGAWVDTDDLNDKKDKDGKACNDLHYTSDGYKILGQRFADKAIELIQKQKKED